MQDILKPTSSVINYDVYNLPPNTNLNVLLNDIDCTLLVAPENGLVGDPIKTDSKGNAKGKILVLSSYAIQLGGVDLIIKFIDKTSAKVYAQVKAIVTSIAGNSTGITNGFIRTYETIPSVNGTVSNQSGFTIAVQGGEAGFSPLTQTFSVDATRYPYGIVVTSAELYVAAKDAEIPLSIELRRVVNGLPSSTEYIQGSSAVVNSESVIIPNNITSGSVSSTKFTFAQPIYLVPGKYALCVLSNSKDYYLYSAAVGSAKLGSPGNIISKEPYVGSLYKPQNTNLWLEETGTGICFKLNKAVFRTGSKTFQVATAGTSYNEFDSVYLDAKQFNFGDQTSISYQLKTTDVGGNVNDFIDIKETSPITLLRRGKINIQGDAVIQVTLNNSNKDVTPAIDKSHSGLYSFKNLIGSR